ncbi:MAG: outer membrane protein assembly factor BamA [Alphaproteobacteria bacterium]|nr:outer membrane protein assembly factor BamA [Alphaproteobacteria bacterium]
MIGVPGFVAAQAPSIPKIVPPPPKSGPATAPPAASDEPKVVQSPDIPKLVPPSPGSGPAVPAPQREAAPSAPSVSPDSGAISDIVVEGTQRIDPNTVLSYMRLKAGEPYSTAAVNESLKALFATGLFADVTIRREGERLVVRVVENPIINQIAFEGNDALSDEELRPEVQLRPRVVFTRPKVQNDVKRILELYRRSGYFAAVVEPKVIQLPQNRVNLVFEIEEGPESGIRSISFVGNNVFSDSTLREVILTKESKWWRILTTADKYDPDRLTFDRELLRRFYLENGYADFRVISAVAELAPDRSDFFVTFTIDEGKRYKFGKIDVASKIKDIKPSVLRPLIKFKTGDWYSSKTVDDTILELTNAAGNFGYAFVEVRPKIRRDRKNLTISVTFEVQEGPRVFVERIDIRGNTRTLDSVIRREFRLVEGDAFNAAKLQRSQQRIRNLGYFSKVDVNKARGSSPDKTIIQVDVQEQPTGELSLGAGFSTRDGVVGEIGIRERNLLGRGQDLKFRVRLSQRTQQFDVGFTEPYFLDRNMSAGVDVFNVRSDRDDESSFREDKVGGRLRLGYEINEQWSHAVRYTGELVDITDVDTDASEIVRNESGKQVGSIVGQTLTYDTRDSRLSPTTGLVSRFATDVAGLGGDKRYIRATSKTKYYYPFSKKWIGSLSGEAGHIRELGKPLTITDRFFLGNDNMRGFEVGGLGPRDRVTDDALGADTFIFGSVELTFPVGLPEEFGVRGAVFSDFGTAFGIDAPSSIVEDSKDLRASAGVGVAWRSPLGPVRLDLAYPFLKTDFDKDQIISFSFGARF